MAHWHGRSYFATLAIRPSEMNGLEYLPGPAKDRLVPVVLLAPWANSRTLEQAMHRFERAFPGRPYILDVDRDYNPTNPGHAAQQKLLSLANSDNSFKNWSDFWSNFSSAVPTLWMAGQNRESINGQIDRIQQSGREFCARFELSRMPQNFDEIVSMLRERGTADFSIILEGGLVSDALTLLARMRGIVDGPLAELDGRVPVVLSCTTMRKDFTSISGVHRDMFSNRALVNKVRERSNRTTIIYGDWGSTKPREDSMGRTPLPRVDYPLSDAWLFARNKTAEWTFSDAANEIVRQGDWDGNLGIWGEQMILATANNDEFAIDSPPKNVAARVNIHLYRQANQGVPPQGGVPDEPWVD